MSLNLGKYTVGNTGGLNSISYGNQAPDVDAVPLSWNAGDFRFYIGTNRSTVGWRCTVGGTPGTWVEVNTRSIDLYLSYGNQSGDGALPTPPEATPAFYLRPNTDKTVQMSFSGSPGATWEYETVFSDPLLFQRWTNDLFIYSCGLTPAGAGPAILEVFNTINGSPGVSSGNLDGLTNSRITIDDGSISLSPGDRVGVKVVTTNVGSGFLMMTSHLHIGP